jgi:RNA polymerase sigma-70 factor (ECF subfamily)
MESQGNDIALFNRMKQGDRLALNTLFTNYYQRLCTFADSYVNNKEEAEEIIADVFFNLWKNCNQLNINTNFRSYLFICVRNACLAALKKPLPLFIDINDAEISDQLINSSRADDHIQFLELEQSIENTISLLPKGCRQTFIMSRYEGLKYKEISEILCISENTVENQLSKALAFLRLKLNPASNQNRQNNYLLNSKVTNR